MVAFNKFFASVFLAILYASSGLAAPSPASLKHAINRLKIVGRGLQLNTFHSSRPTRTFGEGLDHPLQKREDVSLEDRTIASSSRTSIFQPVPLLSRAASLERYLTTRLYVGRF
ncbi:hypothetical protein B0H13DRAFT_589057 [Mycena leptocephala]|nr:hypothetical protein B0H13DRAFT_589057 [Mycena leptocephala]